MELKPVNVASAPLMEDEKALVRREIDKGETVYLVKKANASFLAPPLFWYFVAGVVVLLLSLYMFSWVTLLLLPLAVMLIGCHVLAYKMNKACVEVVTDKRVITISRVRQTAPAQVRYCNLSTGMQMRTAFARGRHANVVFVPAAEEVDVFEKNKKPGSDEKPPFSEVIFINENVAELKAFINELTSMLDTRGKLPYRY
ncbi:MAG: hypothetical protein IJ993_05170 [Akkermansia sp.]|nr:hypothetical protein [Akkermansia sp.]